MRSPAEESIGKRFGILTVIGISQKKSKNGGAYFTCKCDCGTIWDTTMSSVRSNDTTSCGCLKAKRASELNTIDEIGNVYGRLRVTGFSHISEHRVYWKVTCECGNELAIKGSDLRSGRRDMCKTCRLMSYVDSITKDYTGVKYGRLTVLSRDQNNHKMAKCLCICGQEKTVSIGSLITGNTKSCGCLKGDVFKDEAKRIERSAKYQGVSLDEWDGFAKPENKRLRCSPKYIAWRTSVFERDKYTCQKCGGRSKKGHSVELHAHHISNFSSNKELRYDVSNGITLCSCCHSHTVEGSFHSMYGLFNNTNEQINEFLASSTHADSLEPES